MSNWSTFADDIPFDVNAIAVKGESPSTILERIDEYTWVSDLSGASYDVNSIPIYWDYWAPLPDP